MWFDLLIAAILLVCMVRGAMKGFVWQLATIAALVLCFVFAESLSVAIAPFVQLREPLNRWVAMLLLYIVCSFVCFAIARGLRGGIEKIQFVEYDRHLGGLFGLLKGVGLGLTLTFFTVTLSEQMRPAVLNSYSGRAAAVVMNELGPVMPEGLDEVLDPYLNHFDLPPRPRRDDAGDDTLLAGDDTSFDDRPFRDDDVPFGASDGFDEFGGAEFDGGQFDDGPFDGDEFGGADFGGGLFADDRTDPRPGAELREWDGGGAGGREFRDPPPDARPAGDARANEFGTVPGAAVSGGGTRPDERGGQGTNWIDRGRRIVTEEVGRAADDRFRGFADENLPDLPDDTRDRLIDGLGGLLPGLLGGGDRPADPPADPRARRLRERRDALAGAVAAVYSRDADGRAAIRAQADRELEGVPQDVAIAVLEDWYADLKDARPDPDAGTGIATKVSERIRRQLRAHGYALDAMPTALRDRLTPRR